MSHLQALVLNTALTVGCLYGMTELPVGMLKFVGMFCMGWGLSDILWTYGISRLIKE